MAPAEEQPSPAAPGLPQDLQERASVEEHLADDVPTLQEGPEEMTRAEVEPVRVFPNVLKQDLDEMTVGEEEASDAASEVQQQFMEVTPAEEPPTLANEEIEASVPEFEGHMRVVMEVSAHMGAATVLHEGARMDALDHATRSETWLPIRIQDDGPQDEVPQMLGYHPQEAARWWVPCAFCSRRSQQAPKRKAEHNIVESRQSDRKYQKLAS